MAIAKGQGAQLTIAFALTALGWIAQEQQNYDLAITRHRESLAIRRELGSKIHIASALLQELGDEWDIADVSHSLG